MNFIGYVSDFRAESAWLVRSSRLVKTLLIAVLVFVSFGSTSVSAKEFVGTVMRINGEGIQYVAVDILGPRKIFTRTNGDGQFKVDLINGRYTVRLRYRGRRTNFVIEINDEPSSLNQPFKVDW